MEKIIAAFDGLKYSESTRDYSLLFAKQANAHMVGVFLDDPSYTSYKIYEVIKEKGVSQSKLRKLDLKDKEARNAAAKNFEKACQRARLQFSIHHDRKVPVKELIHESIFADLLVISVEETLTHYSEEPPTRFLRDLLGDVQCPVVVVPVKYKPVKKIILLYNGEISSVYAIKMFSYLFPSFKSLKTEVITVNQVYSSLHLPENKLMKEFMKRHYPGAKFTVKEGWGEIDIVEYLKAEREDALVVLGAYGRGAVSRWFRESVADMLMKEVKLPLFIAHNR